MELRKYVEKTRPYLTTAIAATVGIGLSFCANPDIMAACMPTNMRQLFQNIRENGSEREQVEMLIRRIPDGYEHQAVIFMRDKLEIESKKRGGQIKKPHRNLVSGLVDAYNIFTRERLQAKYNKETSKIDFSD